MSKNSRIEQIKSLAKQRGFIYQGSDIYDGLAGTWDYGPLGVELVRNIKEIWWQQFVQSRADMFGVDADILMSPRVWQASGHVDGFADPLVEDKKTKKRYRADHLLENAGIENAEGLSPEEMTDVIQQEDITSPDGNELGEVKTFNMMFETQVGASGESDTKTYLRPETAQGMFVNFKNILDSYHPKVPFGVGQIGKAFRNEITPQNYLYRTREFEQMEVEYFVREKNWEEEFENWREEINEFIKTIGLDTDKVSEYDVPDDEAAHYAKKTIDFEYDYPFGTKELYGLAYRTDYDLKNHIEASGEKLSYYDQQAEERFVPHVIEPSLGIDRTVLALLDSALETEDVDGDERTVTRFNKEVAPIKIAVFPLQRKDKLKDKAHDVFDQLQDKWHTHYDETGSIGKRYRRQDEVGTPYCITVDFQTVEDDNKVTIRDRDTMEQDRVDIENLIDYFKRNFNK
jgi:glycyl-tRNA synthetase